MLIFSLQYVRLFYVQQSSLIPFSPVMRATRRKKNGEIGTAGNRSCGNKHSVSRDLNCTREYVCLPPFIADAYLAGNRAAACFCACVFPSKAGHVPHAHVPVPITAVRCVVRSVHRRDTVGVATQNGRRFQGGATAKKAKKKNGRKTHRAQ